MRPVPVIRKFVHLSTFAAACGAWVALAACSHAPPASPGNPTAAGTDGDPWVIRGSITGGPMLGNPPGPYGSRP